MPPPPTSTPEVVDVKRLDHLPLVGAMLRELAVQETLDALIPPHEREVQQLSDAELLRAYKGQPAAELSFKWAKNPAAIAPIFLETPTRIAVLVYTLVER